MIEVRLFGDLRRYAGEPGAQSGVVLQFGGEEAGTVGQVLARMGIPLDEVGNLFINGRLLPRSSYAITLGYPLAGAAPLSPDAMLDIPVKQGDRLGIFSKRMSILVV